MNISPENTIFVVLSFEGPDAYSMAGGLGARITYLTQALAKIGYEVHHFFIGDPHLEGIEAHQEGRLTLHRWCQWISEHHPNGVYDGEEGKLYDFNESAPPFVVHELGAPAISQGKLVVVLGEEWHTAEAMSRISDLLYYEGLRDKAVMFWNANNTYGFERINWARLSYAITITTVSKYMKHVMRNWGVNPLIIPNGIPKEILEEVDEAHVMRLKGLLDTDFIVSKVARWHPDKGWKPAVEAVGRLKETGKEVVLLARGGIEPYGGKILKRAQSIGLKVRDVCLQRRPLDEDYNAVGEDTFEPYFEALSHAGTGDILNLRFPMPHSFLKVVYRASDVVLANSIHEPFGLVDLEAMATGAVVFTGCSGEDYAMHLVNSIVLDTFSSEEVEFYIESLQAHDEEKKGIKMAARETAKQYIWEKVVEKLIRKLEYHARIQGLRECISAGKEVKNEQS